MRLHILSDLHWEFEPFAPPAVAADALILAGDVSTGRNGLKWALKSFPDRPVIYVLGNHEFYGQKVQKLTKELQEMAQGTNVHLLENQSCTIGDVLFLGATLWTDFALNDWYFETAASSEENRDKVLEAVAKASEHVSAALRIGKEEGKVVWWWPMLSLLACKE